MTKKELVRVYVIKSLIEDKMTSRDAAGVLNLSERQIKRLKAGVKKGGPQSQAKFQSKSRTFFHSCKTKKLNSISSFLLDF